MERVSICLSAGFSNVLLALVEQIHEGCEDGVADLGLEGVVYWRRRGLEGGRVRIGHFHAVLLHFLYLGSFLVTDHFLHRDACLRPLLDQDLLLGRREAVELALFMSRWVEL